MKKIWIGIVIFVLIVLVIIGYMLYQNVEAVHNYFSPQTLVAIHNANTNDEWKEIKINESEYLNFDSKFYTKLVVLDDNSDDSIELRFIDEQGNTIMDNITVKPGGSVLLKKLEHNTNYTVEMKTNSDFVCIRFL